MLPHTVEDRLEPALAGRDRSFIAHFHALREPSVEEISLVFLVGPVLLALFKSRGPLMILESEVLPRSRGRPFLEQSSDRGDGARLTES